MEAQSIANEQMDERFNDGTKFPRGWFGEGWTIKNGKAKCKATEDSNNGFPGGGGFSPNQNEGPSQLGMPGMGGMFGGDRKRTYLLTPPVSVKDGEDMVLSVRKTNGDDDDSVFPGGGGGAGGAGFSFDLKAIMGFTDTLFVVERSVYGKNQWVRVADFTTALNERPRSDSLPLQDPHRECRWSCGSTPAGRQCRGRPLHALGVRLCHRSAKHLPVCLYFLLIIFGTLTLGTNSVEKTFDAGAILLAFFAYGLTFSFGFLGRMALSVRDLIGKTWVRALVIIGKALCMIVVCLGYYFVTDAYGALMGFGQIAALFIISFILGELAGRFTINTPYRIEMMGRLLGFREFIETAEKSRLEHLQHDDPNYYYAILPYAMVFGLSDKWAKQFQNIQVEKPDWYDSTTPLTGYALTHHLTHSINSSVTQSIHTISHDSSSHSSGGGGFSGGGGGGGGGGSW